MASSHVLASALRSVARRATASAPVHRHSLLRSAARRSYASTGHGHAEKTSDMPWLIGSVAVTVPGVAWLLSSGPSKKADAHHHDDASAHGEEKAEAVDSSAEGSSSSESDEKSSSSSESSDDKPAKDANPQASQGSSQTGSKVPPPSADNTDLATNSEDKKEAHEQYKEVIERKDTKVATSSSDMPSKKTAAEHPREDPQKGEGEGVKKGGPEE
ncbi:hypothetical protein F5Y04DRAFT_265971 [Hypomontagnella monticulosa]|nr:hypothetical protein F5Y04DRAFT_265971 [Hypomontagnella monticulosa]